MIRAGCHNHARLLDALVARITGLADRRLVAVIRRRQKILFQKLVSDVGHGLEASRVRLFEHN